MSTPIAIIGLSCLFPGAPNLERFWRNIVEGVDAIGEVPAGRWDPSFYDPESSALDRFYCKRGGFVDEHASFDPLPFGVMPKAAEAIEPDQLLTLKLGFDVLRDAGYESRPFARERTGVIIARGNYVTAGGLRLQQHVRVLPQVLQSLTDLFPDLPESTLAIVRERLQQQLSYYGPDVISGAIPNFVASRLANRLDLRGPAYTVDAACASALLAIEQACASLARRETDAMLVGGVHLSHDLTFWATFCQLGALSRTGTIRPLSQDADGILIGEGIGLAMLKRLDDAIADGDRIYAVIEGSGSSSDGRSSSLVAPSATGQLLALEKAWGQAGISREDIGLVEAHGTGTTAGDVTELETLARFFGGPREQGTTPVIGSVKSMIGHAMPASGMASLIKTALSIYHGVLPPTLHCEEPHEKLAQTRFRVIGRSEPWNQARELRVAAVNAFGFGGINGHLVLRGRPALESPLPLVGEGGPKDRERDWSERERSLQAVPLSPAARGLSPASGREERQVNASELPHVLLLSAPTPQDLLARLERGEHDITPRADVCRLAIVEPDDRKLATARKAIASGKPWNGRQQIWFSPRGLLTAGGKLAFVFPGVDSQFQPRAEDIATYFGLPLPRYCEPLDPAASLVKLVIGLLGFNRYLFERLGDLGIHADVYAGHSVGEWSAMLCSGMLDQALSDQTYAALDVDAVDFPDVLFLAASCSEQQLRDAMQGLDEVAISHDNCPHQVIACGRRAAIEIVADRLKQARIFVQTLPIVSGFHSPLFASHLQPYREFFESAALHEPKVAVWSATTAAKFPAAMVDKQQLAIAHLLEPVRFRSLIESLYDDGARVFVQVGTGSLAGFIDDTLSGRPHQAIQANRDDRSGLAALQQLCAALWVEGAEFDTRLLSDATPPVEAAKTEKTKTTIQLALGVPLICVAEPLPVNLLPQTMRAPVAVASDDALGQFVQQTLADIEAAGRDVLAAWQQHRSPAQRSTHAVAMPSGGVNVTQLEHRVTRHLDIESNVQYVRDHELYPQRPGWPVASDRHPVVPLTMEVMLVREAAEEVLPQLKVIEVEQIQAYRWLAVAEPLDVEIRLQGIDATTIEAEIVGYFRARLRVAAEYPAAPAAHFNALQKPRATAVPAAELYSEGWMFHGPAYQGVAEFQAIGDDGIDGLLRVPTGKGALLDNMGQLAGYWVMEQEENCLAMPIGVDRIRFHTADPLPGEMLKARIRIDELDELNCVTRHELRDASGTLRIAIDGWRTRRYSMDKSFWVASRKLSVNAVSQQVPPNVALFEDRYDTAILRDYLVRRYLAEPERAIYDGLSPRRKRQWLAGRVAAKDAIRLLFWQRQANAPIYPQEVRIANLETGAPVALPNVTTTVPAGLHISIAHKGSLAAAIVGDVPVGIDIEHVEPREAGFVELAFSPDECKLLLADASADADIEYTRGWVAKEVAAKAAGTGLGGQPLAFVIEAREGDCLRVNGHWVVTHPLRDSIVGWSLAVNASASTAFLNSPTQSLTA
ncbi:beta-ketoacyl synthase N-terminal-like domain-containing protein [Hydrocarboniphaga effusa]|uniref:beta-ketoacyl synthase N-terminal-like domain-containing protein n=1 Tax=Hydrocarboniphaga effusa TaxID=243629 RepID=UPI003BA8EBF5